MKQRTHLTGFFPMRTSLDEPCGPSFAVPPLACSPNECNQNCGPEVQFCVSSDKERKRVARIEYKLGHKTPRWSQRAAGCDPCVPDSACVTGCGASYAPARIRKRRGPLPTLHHDALSRAGNSGRCCCGAGPNREAISSGGRAQGCAVLASHAPHPSSADWPLGITSDSPAPPLRYVPS